ncbi:hypothetical protein GCM10023063_18630 [Arthrobacter methylotrophus]|uniref:DUF4381 domain-containing protein n=1 Tax=Arthrobacter methylotrophus TaxID=121291 RepID=A0ABV5UP18_9MICC
MNSTPSPSPIDVFVHNAPAADWQVWAAFAPLLAATVAALIAAAALWQKRRADNRAEWWRRAQWALDSALDEKAEKQEVGLAVLEALNTSKLAGPEEAQILEEAWRKPLQEGEATLDLLSEMPDNGESEDSKEVDP